MCGSTYALAGRIGRGASSRAAAPATPKPNAITVDQQDRTVQRFMSPPRRGDNSAWPERLTTLEPQLAGEAVGLPGASPSPAAFFGFASDSRLPRWANALWSLAHSSWPTYCSTLTLCRL